MVNPDLYLEINYAGRDWKILRSLLADQLENLVARCCDPAVDFESTQGIRGQIKQLREILNYEQAAANSRPYQTE